MVQKIFKAPTEHCTGINAYLIIMTDCTQPLGSQCTISLKEHFQHLAHDGNFLIQKILKGTIINLACY